MKRQSDARFRAAYRESLRGTRVTNREHAMFVRRYRRLIDDVFNGSGPELDRLMADPELADPEGR